MSTKNFFASKVIQGLLGILVGFAIKFCVIKGWLPQEVLGLLGTTLEQVGDLLIPGGVAYAMYGRIVTNGEKLTFGKTPNDSELLK